MADNHAPGLSVATALFLVWAFLFFAARAWVKSRRSENWDWDDSVISAALVVALLHAVAVFLSINAGNGQSVNQLAYQDRDRIEKAIYAGQIFYVCSMGLARISTGIFIARLTRFGRQTQVAYGLTAACGVWMIVSILAISLRGHLDRPWSSLDGSQTLFARWAGIESSGLFLDIALWGVCFQLIWCLSMPFQKRIFVLAIFGCRLLLIPIIVYRLVYLSPGRNTEPGLTNMMANILTEGALEFSIISACVTCLKPFLQPYHPEYVTTTISTKDATWPSDSTSRSHEPWRRLSGVSHSRDDKIPTIQVDEVDSFEMDTNGRRGSTPASAINGRIFRPDRIERQTTVSACRDPSPKSNRTETEEMVIRKTKTWSVSVE